MQKPERKPLGPFWRAVVWLGVGMTAISGLGLAAMTVVTCLDVALRVCGIPVKGAYDIVRVAGAVTIACALPATTAMKGHVAIEYFFQRLNRRWRLAVDSAMRLLMIGGFLLATVESVGYGVRFLKNGQVTDTIELPIFWVPWLMAVSFGVTALVVVFHLVYPGRELVRS
jgi:TRAP-type C4-dicarboxylate transport system permease small subunit